MLRMLRFRGKRVWYLIFAAFATFLIFRWSHQSDPHTQNLDFTPPKIEDVDVPEFKPPVKPATPAQVIEKAKETTKVPIADIETTPPAKMKEPLTSVVISKTSTSTPAAVPAQTVPHVVLPDRKKPPSDVYKGEYDNGEYMHPADQVGRLEVPIVSATTTVHWEKQPEHWPVPTESLIHLPTGEPVKIPKIQHDFNDETTDAKITREKRQSKVKAEFQKAWKGYRDRAWLHDELSPVSGKFRDPFCGWAATLVDTLDTLWIMGLEEEFEEAARAVDLIDFTTSPRSDIPMFETTIRYLGGLLAAYDVSGGKYKSLLDKAVELADIMMGAFDTPNRMPILFYRWKPAFSSQPHRASTFSNTAELGSLSMEFTRLAMLTHEPRYYDAVARVTNAFSEWQDRGTMLEGVFPDNIDASGCNRSTIASPEATSRGSGPALSAGKVDEGHVGYQPNEVEKNIGEPKPKKPLGSEDSDMVEMQVLPGQPAKAKIVGWDDKSGNQESVQVRKRDLATESTLANSTAPSVVETDSVTGLPVDISAAKAKVVSSVGDWDCTPQGLESSNPNAINKFSMGGGQDSTYEYMPKQYLLLGGHEQKYGKMYLKTIEAVRKHMLYRPMIPGDGDILFSGAVARSNDPLVDLKLTPEVEHLTCFIGGMIGMGAKIFGLEGDLELAKKLTDGCVWAYEAFPSGIMPEGALVVPCESTEKCTWNETLYWEHLDPMADRREQLVEEYVANKAAREAEMKAAKLDALNKAQPLSSNGEEVPAKEYLNTRLEGADQIAKPAEIPLGSDKLKKETPDISGVEPGKPKGYGNAKPKDTDQVAKPSEIPVESDSLKKGAPSSLQKRDIQVPPKEDVPASNSKSQKLELRQGDIKPGPKDEVPTPTAKDLTTNGKSEKPEPISGAPEHPLHNISPGEREYDNFVRVNEVASGRQAEVPLSDAAPKSDEELVDPMIPLTHKQWVDARIEQEQLPAAFTMIRSRKYILRPEAIESVWYMYRITGDTTWQDKGWKMFESIIKSTSSEYGHSAIYDVTLKEPYQLDEMESFWLAETLKYFYLLYATPDVISLDEWVLNTEAHPFKRPVEG